MNLKEMNALTALDRLAHTQNEQITGTIPIICNQPLGFSMRGKIKTKQKCTDCGGIFEEVSIKRGTRVYLDMQCPQCRTHPTSFYISIYFGEDIAPTLPSDNRKQKLYRDENGYLFKSYAQAQRFLEDLNRSIDNSEFKVQNYLYKEVDSFKGRNLFYKWFNSKELAPTSMRERKRYVRYYFAGFQDENERWIHEGFFFNRDMRKCNSGTFEDFLAWLPEAQTELKQFIPEKDRKRKFNKLSEKTKKNILIDLRVFFTWLYRREEIDRIPVFPIIIPPDPIIKCTTRKKQELVLNALKPHHRPFFEFVVDHPVRPGEARALKAKYIDTEAWTVHIAEAFSLKKVQHRKSKKDYILPLSYRFNPEILAGKDPDDFIFLNEFGRPYKSENLRRIWHLACKKAGVERIEMYAGTRKTTLTDALIKCHGNYDKVAKFAGHSNPDTTRKHYAKYDIEMLRDLVSDPGEQPAENVVPLPTGHQRGTKKKVVGEE